MLMTVATSNSVVFDKMIIKLAAVLLSIIIFTCNIAMSRKILAIFVTVQALMHVAHSVIILFFQ